MEFLEYLQQEDLGMIILSIVVAIMGSTLVAVALHVLGGSNIFFWPTLYSHENHSKLPEYKNWTRVCIYFNHYARIKQVWGPIWISIPGDWNSFYSGFNKEFYKKKTLRRVKKWSFGF